MRLCRKLLCKTGPRFYFQFDKFISFLVLQLISKYSILNNLELSLIIFIQGITKYMYIDRLMQTFTDDLLFIIYYTLICNRNSSTFQFQQHWTYHTLSCYFSWHCNLPFFPIFSAQDKLLLSITIPSWRTSVPVYHPSKWKTSFSSIHFVVHFVVQLFSDMNACLIYVCTT